MASPNFVKTGEDATRRAAKGCKKIALNSTSLPHLHIRSFSHLIGHQPTHGAILQYVKHVFNSLLLHN